MKQSEHSLQEIVTQFLQCNGIVTSLTDVMSILKMIDKMIYMMEKRGYFKNRPGERAFWNSQRAILRAREINIAKKRGYTKGQADLIATGKKRDVHLELKTKTGRQTPEQKEFEKRVKELGGEYYVVRSLEDVAEVFNLKIC